MAKKFPIAPKHPDRICWGCDKYCSADDLQCGNGSERIQHPVETDGARWYEHGDWQNLLSAEQMQALGLPGGGRKTAEATAKPHIVLKRKGAL